MSLTGKKQILLIIKILVTIAITVWIVRVVSWEKLLELLLSCNPYLIVLVIFLRFFSLPLSAYKWKKLLSIHDVHYAFTQLQRWYLASTFLGSFLPTSIGGDGYRLYKTINNRSGGSCAVLAIFFERLTGSFALLILGYVAIVIMFFNNNDKFISIMFISFTCAGVLSIAIVFIFVKLNIINYIKNSKYFPTKLVPLIENIDIYKKNKILICKVVFVSFVFHLNRIFSVWLLIYALGNSAKFTVLTMALTVTQVLAMIPISLNGIGVVDGSFIYIMDYYGISVETGFSTMLLLRALLLPMILSGAYCYIVDKKPSTIMNGLTVDINKNKL